MISVVPKKPGDAVVFSSSLAEDVWHQQRDPKSYELWHFDALSDDAEELVSITFLDNFVFSSQYNRPEKLKGAEANREKAAKRYPAIEFMYCRNGDTFYRSATQFSENDFEADTAIPSCRIAESHFRYETAEYGSGFTVVVNLALARNRRVEAHFEWLSVEADLLPQEFNLDAQHHFWNVVAPRSDVTGRITVFEKDGSVSDIRHFRGTGYHEHRIDHRWLAQTVTEWSWGRVHFADATAVFCRYRENGEASAVNKLIIIRDSELSVFNADYEVTSLTRDRYGIRYPNELMLSADQGISLSIKPRSVICSSVYLVQFFCDATLRLPDGVERVTTGIADFLVPGALKNRWINWLSDI